MASSQPGSSAGASSSSASQEFVVRIPKNVSKRYSIMRFNGANKIDFSKFQQAKIARENNLKEYKSAHDIEDLPKFGAGSEFGKEQRDEARRKKYGLAKRVYNAEDQPWLLKLGSGKQAKKFKGTREGGISENASYYIFTQCPDGAFEALPVSEWHNFMPLINYKYLSAEEAEEEFTKRDKTMNYFSLMLKKRLRNEDDGGETEKEKVTTTKKKSKDFMLTEMEDWGDMSDDSEKEAGEEDNGEEAKTKKQKKNFDSDDEAVEESDEGDFDDKEVDYMSDTSKSDTDDEEREGKDKYGEKGVEDEDGLRTLNESDDEEEVEKPKETEGEEEREKTNKQGSEHDNSSSSSSESDSDDPESGNVTSALFMQKKKGPGSRSNTPIPGADVDKGKKRKGETDSPVPKKIRTDSPNLSNVKQEAKRQTPTPTPQQSGSNEGITEESVRRYLTRKPMTTKDLLQKFKSKKTGLGKEQLVTTIAAILKKLNPNKEMIKGTMYLSIKE